MRLTRTMVFVGLATWAQAVGAAETGKPDQKAVPRNVKVERRTIKAGLTVPTVLAPNQGVELTAPVAGQIHQVHGDLGTRVKSGQLLATIWPTNAKQDVKLQSPIDGVVIARAAQPGMWVQPGPGVLFSIVDDSAMHAELDIPESEVALFKAGQPVSVQLYGYPNRVFAGKVSVVVPHVDPRTHTVHLEADVPNPDRTLLTGMSGQASFDFGQHQNALAVPRAAVSADGPAASVFVVEGGKAHRRAVTLGLDDGDMVEVVSGLKDGESVVVGPVQEGQTVQ